jgi:polyhydroxyalkanoate synthase
MTGNNGLAEYTAAISECVAQISGGKSKARPFMIGHSLGGTLAGIYGATASDAIRGLLLLSAPLCFQPATSHFRDALVSLVPRDMSDTEPCPGSLLSQMSALASPHTFLWSRLTDAALSLADGHSLEIHARVERWALDEVPLPGKLVSQLIEWLYRENRFCQGNLTIGGKRIGPRNISVPTLAVANTGDDVAPLDSIKPFIDAMHTQDVRIIQYPGEIGVCLQHLGILIGRQAHARVWPEIFSWMDAHR